MPARADSQFSLAQLIQTTHTAPAGPIGDLATRVLKFIAKNFDAVVPELQESHREEMDRLILEECGPIEDPAAHVREFRFRRAAEAVVANATVANVFVDRMAPWALRKEDPAKAASALNTLCEWLNWQARWMAPLMPTKAQQLWEMLGHSGQVSDELWPGTPDAGSWRSLTAGAALGNPEALFPRLTDPASQT